MCFYGTQLEKFAKLASTCPVFRSSLLKSATMEKWQRYRVMPPTMTTANAAAAAEQGEQEATIVAMVPPVDENIVLIASERRETDFSLQQDESNHDREARYRSEETSMYLPESALFSQRRPSTEYSFVRESGVLHSVPFDEGQAEEAVEVPTLPNSHTIASIHSNEADATQTVTTIPQTEAYDEETDAVIIPTAEVEGGESTAATAFASAERVENDFAQTATVVSTVDDCSDDAVIRKILQEDLIASGRSTDELQQYIQTASLENVVSRVSQATEEEKTEIAEPDSALAWAIHENEVLSSMSNMFAENEQQHVSVATIPEEQATVVGITEHDVHPAELTSAARAELIGEDYSVNYLGTRDTIDDPSPPTQTATAFTTVEEHTAAEATVLDSKPAATVAANPWSANVAEEATVLETKPPADETWSRPDDEAREVTVDAVVEEEGLVVGITEDVHPYEFVDEDARPQATFIGQADYGSAMAVDAVEEDGPRMVHFIEETMAPATPITSGQARAVSYSTPPAQRPPSAARAVSDPPRNPVASPVDYAVSGSFDAGIAALDAHEQNNWMNRPSSFQFGDEVLMPPPPPRSSTTPAPMAAAQVLDERSGSSCTDVPPLPPRTAAAGREPRTSSTQTQESERSSGTTGSSRRAAASLQLLSTAAVRGTNSMVRSTSSMMDVLFGESRQPQHGFDLDAAAGSILPRTLLPWSVFPKPSGMWVATVNTNQKALDSGHVKEASKALRAFSCATQTQAEALARAWAPPRMLPFTDNPTCFICESKFAVFRRACHCRNCGVCVCNQCVVQWPSKMLPETYNIKKESVMNVCKSCDWLCSTLRLALLNGQHDQAIAVHATGNVNLVTPFANVKGELFYPVHCAVLGGSLSLLKWLVDDHCCPLRSLRVGGRRQSRGSYTPILTSRGRSLLGIAMENRSLDIVRYLVADKNMSLTEEKSLSLETTILNLEAALRRLPADADGTIPDLAETNTADSIDFVPTRVPPEQVPSSESPIPMASMPQETSQSSFPAVSQETSPATTNGIANAAASVKESGDRTDDASSGSVEDACIICFANTIDCVVTPCGHQICCMQCSTHITRCPVCSVDCSFIRVYKP